MLIKNCTDRPFVLTPTMGKGRYLPNIKLIPFNYIIVSDSLKGYYTATLNQLQGLITITDETPEQLQAYLLTNPEDDVVDSEQIVNVGGMDIYKPVTGYYSKTLLPFDSKTGERQVYVNHITGI